MKIALVAPYFPPEVTGSSNFVADIARSLTELGHEVLVITASGDTNSADYEVVSLPARRISPGRIAFGYSIPIVAGLRNYRRMYAVLRDFGPDIVALHGQIFDVTLLAGVIARRLGIPTAMTVHSAVWHDNAVLNAVLGAGDKILARLFLRRIVDAWVGVDDRTIEHIKNRYSKKAVTIPIGIRRNQFAIGDASIAIDKYRLNGSPLIASIGHVVPVRNRLDLVRALPLVRSEFPDVRVAIVGRVADDSFVTLAEEIGVLNSIDIVGPIPHADIAHVLALSDVEVHDLQGFGLGIASLEPIDAGVPIIAYARDNNIPNVSLRSYCQDTFLADNEPQTIASCLIRLLKDASFRKEVVGRQRKLLNDVYYLDVVVDDYVKLFNRLNEKQ